MVARAARTASSLFGGSVAEKFQREVHGFGANPAGGAGFGFQLRDQVGEGAADRVGQVECDEQAHVFTTLLGVGKRK